MDRLGLLLQVIILFLKVLRLMFLVLFLALQN